MPWRFEIRQKMRDLKNTPNIPKNMATLKQFAISHSIKHKPQNSKE